MVLDRDPVAAWMDTVVVNKMAEGTFDFAQGQYMLKLLEGDKSQTCLADEMLQKTDKGHLKQIPFQMNLDLLQVVDMGLGIVVDFVHTCFSFN